MAAAATTHNGSLAIAAATAAHNGSLAMAAAAAAAAADTAADAADAGATQAHHAWQAEAHLTWRPRPGRCLCRCLCLAAACTSLGAALRVLEGHDFVFVRSLWRPQSRLYLAELLQVTHPRWLFTRSLEAGLNERRG